MRLKLVAAAVVMLALFVSDRAGASRTQFTMFEAPRELTSDDDALRVRTLQEIRSLGVHWLRVILYWRDVAPQPDSPQVPSFDERDPAAYPGFGKYDRIIDEARAAGMRVLLTVSGPVPKWATRDRDDYRTSPSARRFGRFMAAVGKRYRSRVSHWSIWNEPNHPRFLLPQYTRGRGATSPRIYRRLFQAAESGLDLSGNARDRVLMGETAPRGTSRVVAPLRFLRGALCLDSRYRKRRGCARLQADGYAHHAYTTRSGPWFRPRGRDDVTIGVLPRLNRALARAGRTGAIRRGTGIYLTEFGVQSRPDPFVGVSETAQAEYRSISERIAYRNGRVRAFSQYLMRDDDPREGVAASRRYAGFETGLRGHLGDEKRAYEGFRLPLVANRGRRRVSLWGLVRPTRGRTRVTIQYRVRDQARWHYLKRDTTNARGYWSTTTANRGRRYRIRWRAPDGNVYTGPLTRAYRR